MSGEPTQRTRAKTVAVAADAITVELHDGHVVSAPLAWYPRLLHATQGEREHWRLVGNGDGVRWPDLDEDIDVEHLIAGRPSGESQDSLKRWIEERSARKA